MDSILFNKKDLLRVDNGDDFFNFMSDVDENGGGGTKRFNLSDCVYSCSSYKASCGGGGDEEKISTADEDEELEWLNGFPDLDYSVIDDKLGEIGFIGQLLQHSPVSVLESIIGTGTGCSTGFNILHVPTGFPNSARKKRGARRRLCDFGSFKHLFSNRAYETDYNQETAIRPVKKIRKTRDTTVGRSCLHCGSDKTPQWRTGPMGKKTLCNACGVRYMSGRLVPEYRPANSPTFSSVMHSNSHRKIVEMRKLKHEGIGQEIIVIGT